MALLKPHPYQAEQAPTHIPGFHNRNIMALLKRNIVYMPLLIIRNRFP